MKKKKRRKKRKEARGKKIIANLVRFEHDNIDQFLELYEFLAQSYISHHVHRNREKKKKTKKYHCQRIQIQLIDLLR